MTAAAAAAAAVAVAGASVVTPHKPCVPTLLLVALLLLLLLLLSTHLLSRHRSRAHCSTVILGSVRCLRDHRHPLGQQPWWWLQPQHSTARICL
jgi:hypothetical protein